MNIRCILQKSMKSSRLRTTQNAYPFGSHTSSKNDFCSCDNFPVFVFTSTNNPCLLKLGTGTNKSDAPFNSPSDIKRFLFDSDTLAPFGIDKIGIFDNLQYLIIVFCIRDSSYRMNSILSKKVHVFNASYKTLLT